MTVVNSDGSQYYKRPLQYDKTTSTIYCEYSQQLMELYGQSFKNETGKESARNSGL